VKNWCGGKFETVCGSATSNFDRVFLTGSVYCQSPAVVNIGAVFTFNSTIGRVAKVVMETAISDVNVDPRILNRTKLNLKFYIYIYILKKKGYRLPGFLKPYNQ